MKSRIEKIRRARHHPGTLMAKARDIAYYFHPKRLHGGRRRSIRLSGERDVFAGNDVQEYDDRIVISDLLELRLDKTPFSEGRAGGSRYDVNIYVAGEQFNQCKFLVATLPPDDPARETIDSIDELATHHGARRFEARDDADAYGMSPRDMLRAHASNIHAWYAHGYDTRILHSNLAFPLLKALARKGDWKAKDALQREIHDRLKSGSETVALAILGTCADCLTVDNLKEMILSGSPSVRNDTIFKINSFQIDETWDTAEFWEWLAERMTDGEKIRILRSPITRTAESIILPSASKEVKIAVSEIVRWSDQAADILSRDDDADVRRSVAEQKVPSPIDTHFIKILSILAKDLDAGVRSAVARNPSIGPDTALLLSHDRDDNVRKNASASYIIGMAGCLDSGGEFVDVVAGAIGSGDVELCRVAAVANYAPENVPVLVSLLGSGDRTTRVLAALNPSVDVDVLKVSSTDSDPLVRCAVAVNEKTPVDIVTKLRNDKDRIVSMLANKKFNASFDGFVHTFDAIDVVYVVPPLSDADANEISEFVGIYKKLVEVMDGHGMSGKKDDYRKKRYYSTIYDFNTHYPFVRMATDGEHVVVDNQHANETNRVYLGNMETVDTAESITRRGMQILESVHRPRRLAEVLGNEEAAENLRRALEDHVETAVYDMEMNHDYSLGTQARQLRPYEALWRAPAWGPRGWSGNSQSTRDAINTIYGRHGTHVFLSVEMEIAKKLLASHLEGKLDPSEKEMRDALLVAYGKRTDKETRESATRPSRFDIDGDRRKQRRFLDIATSRAIAALDAGAVMESIFWPPKQKAETIVQDEWVHPSHRSGKKVDRKRVLPDFFGTRKGVPKKGFKLKHRR